MAAALIFVGALLVVAGCALFAWQLAAIAIGVLALIAGADLSRK